MPARELDPVNAATAITALVLGPSLAAIVGPYAVILIAATTGAAWALGRREQTGRLGAAWYFVRMNATAVLLTVSLATLARIVFGLDEERWLLAPIALIVGGVGDDWPLIGRWLLSRLARIIEQRSSDNKE